MNHNVQSVMRSISTSFVIILLFTSKILAANTLIEHVQSTIKSDKSLSQQQIESYLSELLNQLGTYGFDILKPPNTQGAEVLLTIISEGLSENVDPKRTVAIAKAAYLAIRKGAPAEAVLGIASYGFHKEIKSDHIERWAVGFADLLRFSVAREVALELVYQAATQSWNAEEFTTFKWALVEAQKAGYHLGLFVRYLFGNYKKGKMLPGEMVARTLRAFRLAEVTNTSVPLPPYQSPVLPLPPKKATPQTALTPTLIPTPTSPKTPLKKRLLALTRKFLGAPYVWGGSSPKGTDCSGLTQAVFAQLGITLPRSAREQWRRGKPVRQANLRAGDLVFFRTLGKRISHVGIVTDPSKRIFIHASSSRGVVRSNLNAAYYRKRYQGARRLLP